MGEQGQVMTEQKPKRKRGRPSKAELERRRQEQEQHSEPKAVEKVQQRQPAESLIAGPCPTCGCDGAVYKTRGSVSYCKCTGNADHKWSRRSIKDRLRS